MANIKVLYWAFNRKLVRAESSLAAIQTGYNSRALLHQHASDLSI